MANSIPVQTGAALLEQTGPVVAPVAEGGFAGAFAALLAGLVPQKGSTSGPGTPKPADLVSVQVAPPKDGPPGTLPATGGGDVTPVALIGMLREAPVAKPLEDKLPVRGKNLTDSDSVLASQSPDDQTAAPIILSTAGVPPPVLLVASDLPTPMPLAAQPPNPSGTVVTQALAGSVKEDAVSHRPAPTSPRGAQPVQQEGSASIVPAPLPSELKSEKTVAVATPPDLITISIRSDTPQSATPLQSRLSEIPAPTGEARTPPVDQVSPVLVGMLKSADGTQSITIRLQPEELGQVQIRIDRTNDGTAHVGIIAERPETLQLLQRDQPRLEQALDQAGVSSSGRTVSFQAVPDQVGASASRPDSMAAGSGGFSQGQSSGAWREASDMRRDPQDNPDFGPEPARARWVRVGLDITA